MAHMANKILLIQGHPDPAGGHLCHALAQAYGDAARDAGREVRTLDVAQLDFPLLRSQHAWNDEPVPPALAPAQDDIRWAEHLVFFFPLWLGGMPALLKGFLEQVARPGFALKRDAKNPLKAKMLQGRSARLVVTMGMPALVYRFYFRAHSIKALERNILGFVGIAPIDETLIGLVEAMNDKTRTSWFEKLRTLGRRGA
jgi:putative NADPH-quinone reductase